MKNYVLFLALGVAAVSPLPGNGAASPSEPHSPGGSTPVTIQLASQMRLAARGLERGERRDATSALDRSRHLADAAAFDDTIDGALRLVLRGAYAAVDDARRALQNGDEAKAQAVLDAAATALDRAQVAAPALRVSKPERAHGMPALNDQGAKLGTVVDVQVAGNGVVVRVRRGGFLGFGGEVVSLRSTSMLVGRHYVLLV